MPNNKAGENQHNSHELEALQNVIKLFISNIEGNIAHRSLGKEVDEAINEHRRISEILVKKIVQISSGDKSFDSLESELDLLICCMLNN